METGSELIALLLESDEIKKIQPFFNKAQKRTSLNHFIFPSTNENGYLTLRIGKGKESENIISVASSYDHALQIIDKLIRKFKLCQKLCAEYNIVHACFGYSVKECKGACIGKEIPEEYNSRVQIAIDSLQFTNPNFMIIERGRSMTEKSIVHIEKGKYVGYGYFDPEFITPYPETLKDCIKYKPDNRDVDRIIRQYLSNVTERNLLIY